jgi:hypothetical protein
MYYSHHPMLIKNDPFVGEKYIVLRSGEKQLDIFTCRMSSVHRLRYDLILNSLACVMYSAWFNHCFLTLVGSRDPCGDPRNASTASKYPQYRCPDRPFQIIRGASTISLGRGMSWLCSKHGQEDGWMLWRRSLGVNTLHLSSRR